MTNPTGQPGIPSGAIVFPGPYLVGQPLRIGETCPATFDPRVSGYARPVGALLFATNGTICYQKTGTGTTAWALVGAGGGATTAAGVSLADAAAYFGPAGTLSVEQGMASVGSSLASQSVTLASHTATLAGLAGYPNLLLSDATTTAPTMQTFTHQTSAAISIGFGATNLEVWLKQSTASTSKKAWTEAVTIINASLGAEQSQIAYAAMLAGSTTPTKVGGWGFNAATYPMLFVGDPASVDGFRRVTAGTRLDLMLNGTAYWAFASTSECFAHVKIDGNLQTVGLTTCSGGATVTASRLLKAQGAAVASGGTLTLGTDGNYFHVSGTTTINFITYTGWQAGSSVTLIFDGALTVTGDVASPPANTYPIRLAFSTASAAQAVGGILTLMLDVGMGRWVVVSSATNSGG